MRMLRKRILDIEMLLAVAVGSTPGALNGV
jgi:hypothetical protein